MKKISIIGCGAIGTEVASAIDRQEVKLDLVSIFDIEPKKALDLKNGLTKQSPKITESVEKAIAEAKLVFESTNVDSAKEIADICMEQKKDLFLMSVGTLVKYPEILQNAEKAACKITFPSGAIGGMDVVTAFKIAGIESAKLKTTKPLRTLVGTLGLEEYLKAKKMSPDQIKVATTIFEGNVNDAISLFPKNINVSATLAILGIGAQKTTVEIVADPLGDKNIHEITCVSPAGILRTQNINEPYPANPKTSYLAILSAISKLQEL